MEPHITKYEEIKKSVIINSGYRGFFLEGAQGESSVKTMGLQQVKNRLGKHQY